MQFKEFNVKYRDDGNGTIEGYASTWIREPDSYGDIVKEGAFTRTLEERWNGGKSIPLLWAHQMDNLSSYIGTAEAKEDEKGLHFLAAFDDTDEAQRVRELYKDRRLSKFSFAFDIKDAGPVELDGGRKANELRDLDLFEISCVCVPANDDAGVVAVKATELDTKAGKRNSKKDEDAIRQAITLLQGVLDNEEEDEPEDNGAPEDQKESNSELNRSIEILRRHKL